jgi:outer membrane protein assembly factor BamB
MYENDININVSKERIKIYSHNDKEQPKLTFSYQQSANYEIMWNYPIEADTGPFGLVVRDLNSDGEVEVIFAVQERDQEFYKGKVYALNGSNGIKLWDYVPGIDFVSTAPSLGDIDDDNKLEVIIGGRDEYVIAIEDDGLSSNWDTDVGSGINTDPTLGDIDNDSKLEVVVGFENSVTALEAENGFEKWTFTAGGQIQASVALGDINNDQEIEVIVGSLDGNIYALRGIDGFQLWNYTSSGSVGVPILADVNNDQQLEVIFGDKTGDVTAINAADGSHLWHFPTGNSVELTPALGDINNDKKLDVIICSTDGYIYVLEGETGNLIWRKNVDPSTAATLGDIDDDHKLEVIFGSAGDLIALNGEDKSEVLNIPFSETINYQPVLHDLNHDKKLEIIFQTEGYLDSNIYAVELQNSGLRNYWTFGGNKNYTFTQNLYDVDPDMDFLSTETERIIGTKTHLNDTDKDNMLDGWEFTYSPDLNPLNGSDSLDDPDGDTLTNIQEYNYNTNPSEEDTDGDNMPDDWEVTYGTDPRKDDAEDDPDSDGLNNLFEYLFSETDPNNNDTDADALSDGFEVDLGTNPTNNDTDTDTMPDGWEYYHGLRPGYYNSDTSDADDDDLTDREEYNLFKKHGWDLYPNHSDTDDDELSDGYEVETSFTNPTNNDTDNDGMPDGWEDNYSTILDPNNHNDSLNDPDTDNLANYYEFLNSTDPTNPDTDDDDLLDGEEIIWGTNPTINDTDADELLDGLEIDLGLNATNPDTDGDGDLDGEEYGKWLLDPKNPNANTRTRALIIYGGLTSLGFLALGGASYRFVYVPRRVVIKDWWNRRILRLYQRDEEVLEYAGKARKVAKKFDEKKE